MPFPNPKNDAVTALSGATQKLEAVSDTPRLDAELLLAHALGMERGAMLLQLRDLTVPDGFDALIHRRLCHEPVAYIIGHQDFWDLTLHVSPAVLIPRADSETLIEAARDFFSTRQPHRILDLGTGSGALLLAALSLFPNATGIGIDASPSALDIAQGNAAKLGFASRAAYMEASWHDAGWSDTLGQYDLILCNPPYVETNADLAPQVRDFEPHSALYSGDDGLKDYHILIPQIPALLNKGGVAIFELGMGQAKAVQNMATHAGLASQQHKDLAGIIRALALTAKASG
jgi:release factor glutamine methyltransferase